MPRTARTADPWLLRAIAGDRSAWERVLERHGPMVWGICRRLAADPEDAYQAVWVRVFEALPRFDPDGAAALGTWIGTIAHRHLVDLHRRHQVRGQVVPITETLDPRPLADELVDRSRRLARLERALEALPDPQRRVVVMHHLYDASLEALARGEGVAVGTVKSRLHRGRARLAQLLGGDR
jgi:RNA polymerase sigma-70 factor (ECF subfamily)